MENIFIYIYYYYIYFILSYYIYYYYIYFILSRCKDPGQATRQSSSLVTHDSLLSGCFLPTPKHVLAQGPGGWGSRKATSGNPTKRTVELGRFRRPGAYSGIVTVLLLSMHPIPSGRPGRLDELIFEEASSLCISCRVALCDG